MIISPGSQNVIEPGLQVRTGKDGSFTLTDADGQVVPPLPAISALLREMHETGRTVDGYFVGQIDDNPNVVELTADEQRYLEQLNMEVLYAQKAYFGFLNHLRRTYGCPEGEWAMNNIDVGFERIEVSE